MTSGVVRIALVAAVLGLSGVVGKSALDVIDVSPAVPIEAAPVTAGVASNQVAIPALEDLQATRERPLFAPTRRPSPAIVEKQAEGVRGLTLIGMMRPAGRDGRVLIRVDGAAAATWVGKGGEIAGYVVQNIAADGVTVDRDGRRLVLTLRPTRTAQD